MSKLSFIEQEYAREKRTKPQTVKINIEVTTEEPYTRRFDKNSPAWSKTLEYNIFYLILQQNYANERLKMQGYLFLNEVFDMLGFPRTDYGSVVGWLYDEKNPVGDNFVDFGIFDIRNRSKDEDFSEGIELNFNVDGNILDRL